MKGERMPKPIKTAPTAVGGCLCGAVRYEIYGPLRNVVNCHCAKCRRFHGNFGAYTRIKYENLLLTHQSSLKWYRSVTDETPGVHRGFCGECGSSLFWHPRGQEYIAVAAGSLDEPTRLKTIGHIWLNQRGDFYELNDDLPRFEERWNKSIG